MGVWETSTPTDAFQSGHQREGESEGRTESFNESGLRIAASVVIVARILCAAVNFARPTVSLSSLLPPTSTVSLECSTQRGARVKGSLSNLPPLFVCRSSHLPIQCMSLLSPLPPTPFPPSLQTFASVPTGHTAGQNEFLESVAVDEGAHARPFAGQLHVFASGGSWRGPCILPQPLVCV